MSESEIDYPQLVDAALRTVAREVLRSVAADGLPGDHHFYISFHTDDPDVEMSDRLRQAYPEEMTIVLQNQFWDLEVDDDAFEVKLRFAGEPQRLRIPWRALRSFIDPAAEFGLRFESFGDAAVNESVAETTAPGETATDGEVVSFEEFRRRDS